MSCLLLSGRNAIHISFCMLMSSLLAFLDTMFENCSINALPMEISFSSSFCVIYEINR